MKGCLFFVVGMVIFSCSRLDVHEKFPFQPIFLKPFLSDASMSEKDLQKKLGNMKDKVVALLPFYSQKNLPLDATSDLQNSTALFLPKLKPAPKNFSTTLPFRAWEKEEWNSLQTYQQYLYETGISERLLSQKIAQKTGSDVFFTFQIVDWPDKELPTNSLVFYLRLVDGNTGLILWRGILKKVTEEKEPKALKKIAEGMIHTLLEVCWEEMHS